MALDVPARAILLDAKGVSTQATVEETSLIFEKYHIKQVLAVSHFYHLPRIKLTYQQSGMEVFTVPAKESYLLTKLPYFMLRETAAFWVYYMRNWAGAGVTPTYQAEKRILLSQTLPIPLPSPASLIAYNSSSLNIQALGRSANTTKLCASSDIPNS